MKEGTVASFETTRSSDRVLRAYPGSTADVGKKLRFQGRDRNGIWVRTAATPDGPLQDGEEVTLAMPFVETVTVWGPGAPVAVIKDVTEQRVLVYSRVSTDLSDSTLRLIADYEAGETRPSYIQSYVPLKRGRCCGGESGDTIATTTVTALVGLQHVELRSPGDWLILQNLPAYKAAMVAVKAKEEKDFATFNFEFYGTQASARNGRGVERVVNRGGAIPLLVAELRRMSSDRTSAYVYLDETEKYTRMMLGFR